ncbi:MAG: hypothetical protein NVS4B11_20270 [Ktedonobacteraceae bacterium]
MTENTLSLTAFYKGWDIYQQHLVTAIAPLSSEQLALCPAPHLWSAGMLATHIVSTRVWWFHLWMGAGDANLVPLAMWDEPEAPVRSSAELVAGLESTWHMIQNALVHWTPADLEQIFQRPGDQTDKPRLRSRQWIIWHLLEHDLHHGGELSLILGMYGLPAIDL